jgi:hypothetical protein
MAMGLIYLTWHLLRRRPRHPNEVEVRATDRTNQASRILLAAANYKFG